MGTLTSVCGIGEIKMSNNVQPLRKQGTPESTPTGGNGGGGYYDLSERIARLETEFKEVVKKSDLQEQTRVLENTFREETENR